MLNKENLNCYEKRDNYIKRPKISNITQIVCVLSAKNPKPDLLMLDKQLAYAEYVGIKAVIVINKIDLDKKRVEEIKEIYKDFLKYPNSPKAEELLHTTYQDKSYLLGGKMNE